MAESQSNVEYRRLGNSGLKVSVPILGCMSYGSSDWQPWVVNEDQALPIIKAAYDKGINTWDTANVYSNGESERIVGKALKKFGIPRERVVIMTKCYAAVGDTPGERAPFFDKPVDPKYINNMGLSRKAIFSAVEKSLERLGTDYIDLFQIHRYDYDTPPEETMEALHDIVKSGKVRYIGASSMYTYQFQGMQHIADLKGYTKFISMQNHYSLLYREEEREMNAYCKNTGVGLIPWSPLARGHLARPLNASTIRSGVEKANVMLNSLGASEQDQTIIRRVEEIANKKGWKMATVALVWISARVSSPIVGAGSVERVEGLLEVTGKKLTAEEEKYLEEAYVPRSIIGHL